MIWTAEIKTNEVLTIAKAAQKIIFHLEISNLYFFYKRSETQMPPFLHKHLKTSQTP